MSKKTTAADVARAYSAEAAWVPCPRAMPPHDETVEVLYRDGIVARCVRANAESNLFLFESDGNYRYVDAIFWRPTKS